MSTILDAPQKLGEYMLKGWVLTDLSCASPSCHLPLMRSPPFIQPQVHFCVNCDAKPQQNSNISSATSDHSKSSRSSTPPTEMSIRPESPLLEPFVETEEFRLRREQLDRASQEIGNRLLKGWTMLSDECPNVDCYGVPLVRPPKPGGEKDPRKECVICGGIYISETDWAGRQRLTLNAPNLPTGNTSIQLKKVSTPESHTVQIKNDIAVRNPREAPPPPTEHSYDAASIVQTLQETSQALQNTLGTLTSRLSVLSAPNLPVDPSSISATADAVSKVARALSDVKQLHWSELQAHTLRMTPDGT
ncbi:hypothetical protein AMATHDRAFT_3098 [Amanita thiersii Skay4041]|uniref:Uncharacterized protein n=1 Tax=Amanita thiersii Skay4041 TaxID=703135 RepID=A0A2A9NUV5_9AGAR|nr:hypothetical protein AMATHDRAFT_3098 [Amanita thiersii Skay4041]